MKKGWKLICVFGVCIMCLAGMVSELAITAHAAAEEEETAIGDTKDKPQPGGTYELDGIIYKLYNGVGGIEAEVVSYIADRLADKVELPEAIIVKETKLPVTAVSDGAFQNAPVTRLSFPAAIISFGKNIIAGCSKLDVLENRSAVPFILPENLEREGYYFRYWRNSNYEEIHSIAGGSAYTLYTNYKYTLVFDSNGGSPVDSVTAYAYQCAKAPADPVREGYTFAGWYTSPYFSEESKWDFAKDYRNYPTTVKLFAKWKKNTKTSYQVASVSGFKVKSRRKNGLTLTWKRLSGVTGYQLYMYNNEKKDFELYTSTADCSDNTVTVYGLDAGKTYQFQVRAYSLIDGKRRHGEFTQILKTVTKPDKPTNIKLKSSKKKQVRVSFQKVKSCSGYELQISTKKSFSKKNTRTYKLGKGAKSKTVKKLKSQKKYYIRMRAYITFQGKTYYGAYTAKRRIICK